MAKVSILQLLCGFFALVSADQAAAAVGEPAHRVVVLLSTNQGSAFEASIVSGIEQALKTQLQDEVALDIDSLDLTRNPDPAYEDAIAGILKHKYKGHVDLVIAIRRDAERFLYRRYDELFPGTTVIISSGTTSEVQPRRSEFHYADWTINVKDTLALAGRLDPRLRHVYVVSGTAPADRVYYDIAKRDLEMLRPAQTIEYLENETRDSLMKRVAELPPHSAVLYLLFSRDRDGTSVEPAYNYFSELAKRSAAPVYALFSSFMGIGAAGGAILSGVELGQEIGSRAAGWISGQTIPSSEPVATHTQLDWEVVSRFGLETTGYGAEQFINRPPDLLFEYRRYLVAGIAVIIVQGLLLAGIFYSYVMRVRSERQVVAARRREEALREQLANAARMEALGQMAGGIAHDFNNILAIQLGAVETVKAQSAASDPELRRHLDVARTATLRAKELVRQLLLFAKGDAQASTSDRVLEAVIDDVAPLLRSALPRAIELECDIARLYAYTSVPAPQVQQILMNLVINARDAVAGHGRIHIGLRRRDATGVVCSSCRSAIFGGYLSLTVRDTGSGMPSEVLGRIFEPFFSTKSADRGTGMGLSTVDRILHRHAGHLRVQSEVDKGTVFEVYLPETLPDSNVAPVASAQQRHRGLLERKRVWVVDDEATLGIIVGEMLKAFGVDIKVFSSSRDALSCLMTDEAGLDLLITDETMPVMKGTELIQKARLSRPTLPAILCSGDVLSPRPDEVGILSKPFTQEELLGAVVTALHAGAEKRV